MNVFKKLMLISTLMVWVLGFANRVYAQTDYIINNDAVRIMGEVKSFGLDKVKFIPVGEKKVQKFNPKQIKEFYKAGPGMFRSIAVQPGKKASFLQVLEDGKVKLYEYYRVSTAYNGGLAGMGGIGYGYSNTKKTWYAQKDGGEIVEVKSNGIWGSRKERKDNFLNMIKDNAHVAERYEKADKFNFDFVRSLISEYNILIAKAGTK